jgi:hypothetical protein
MALIQIPNAYTRDMVINAGRRRFAVIGEPIVAVDLINTVAPPGSPTADDLLPTDRDAEAWWRTQRTRVPGGDRGSQLLHAVGTDQHATAADRDGAGHADPMAPGARREPAAGLHRRSGRSLPVRPGPGQPAAPVRQPGLFDDLHSGQPPPVMVCARRMRQPGPRGPPLPSRRRGLTRVRAGPGDARPRRIADLTMCGRVAAARLARRRHWPKEV